MRTVKSTILRKVYKRRNPKSHKGNFGNLLIIGGSSKYSGSPALAGIAAYRSGTDLVTITAPSRAADIIAGFTPDLITIPLKGNHLSKSHARQILSTAKNKEDAIVIGNGLGTDKDTASAIKSILKQTKLPCVIDADAITAVSKDPSILKGKKFVLTPHSREFKRLTGINVDKLSNKEKADTVKEQAKKLKTTILLKGNPDVISDGYNTAINTTGNAYMTTGGTGDVLAGVLGSLLAQGNGIYESACAAAYITGKAGEKASRKRKQGLMASDMLDTIPDIL